MSNVVLAKKKAGSGPSISPDDDVFRFLSLTFSRSHHTMATTTVKCDGESFKDGITNGAEWFPIAGMYIKAFLMFSIG